MNPTLYTYAVYTILSLALTIWVARTLHRNGRVFLVDVFAGRADLADSVNHLLVVGFYLVNFGYASLALKLAAPVPDAIGAVEALSHKTGFVLVVLGAMHFLNLFVFSKIRGHRRLEQAPPPLPPTSFAPHAAAPGAGTP
jgi:hypothetical protein